MVEKNIIYNVFTRVINKYLSLKHHSSPKKEPMVSFIERDGDVDNGKFKYSLNSIADKLCEKYGFTKGKVDNNNLDLIDEENDTLFKFGQFIKRQDLIDFTDNGYGDYNISEFIDMYNTMPSMMKKETKAIIMDNHDSEDTCNAFYDADLDLQSVVHITPKLFDNKDNTEKDEHCWNVERGLAHEMGHSLDWYKMNDAEKSAVRKIIKGEEVSQEEDDIWWNMFLSTDVEKKTISDTPMWRKSIQDDFRYQLDNGIEVQHSSSYASHSSVGEEWAETISMVSFESKSDEATKSHGWILNEHNQIVSNGVFHQRHPNKTKIASAYLNGDLIYDEKVGDLVWKD